VRPVEFLCAALKDVRNIGAVEPLAFHNVRLHPNHFLWRTKLHRQAKELVTTRPLEPCVIHFAQSVSGAKNQINMIATAPGLGEPMRKSLFRLVARALKYVEGQIDMLRSQV